MDKKLIVALLAVVVLVMAGPGQDGRKRRQSVSVFSRR